MNFYKLFKEINFRFLSFINLFFPKNERKIVIYGRKMFNDNLEAMLVHFINNNYTKKYKIYCLLAEPKVYESKYKNENIYFVSGILSSIFHLLSSKYIFHTHSLSVVAFKACRNQKIFNLWHGSPLKRMGNYKKDSKKPVGARSDNYLLVTSKFFIPISMESYGHTEEQIFLGGNPRNDLLFSDKNCKEILGINNQYDKIILFMPTFRKSKIINRIDSTSDFPIISSKNISEINSFLKENKVLLVIKPHPYQNDIEFLNLEFTNIIKFTNEDLAMKNVLLYELLGQVDALVTDYSSVYFDFLLTQKPIGFVLDDIEEYKDKRGFVVENPMNLMPGEKIYNEEDFLRFIKNICAGIDNYKEERRRINDLANKYQDNKNCERILNFLGININYRG